MSEFRAALDIECDRLAREINNLRDEIADKEKLLIAVRKTIEAYAPPEEEFREVEELPPASNPAPPVIKSHAVIGNRPIRKPNRGIPPPRNLDEEMFLHGDRSVILHPREYRVAVRLRAAQGKGFLDAKLLIDAALDGARPVGGFTPEQLLNEMVLVMNPKISMVGLHIEYHKNFGYVMKDIPL